MNKKQDVQTTSNETKSSYKKIEGAIVGGYKKIEDVVVGGYKKIEQGVVNGYKKLETGVVGGFEKVTDKCVEKLFAKEGESVEDAKLRLSASARKGE